MIRKKIHYVWVGGKDKPRDIKKCMKTWRKHLKDYEIIEWNEDNFDINANKFCKEAYDAKKWAYVSDYIRAHVIYHHGGIYLDTDVLVLDNFDKFLNHRCFVGYENPSYPFTAVFGAEINHPFVKKILDYYDGIPFEYNINDEMEKVNTKIVSDILINDYQCKLGNVYQELADGIVVYPDNILCNPSKDSVSIHVFTGTWIEASKPLARKINKFLKINIKTKFHAHLFDKIIRRK